MDRIWQWAWDRYGSKYLLAVGAIAFAVALPVYLLLTIPIVAFEESHRYAEAAGVTVLAVLVLCAALNTSARRGMGSLERWAAGDNVERASALEATYSYSRLASAPTVWGTAVLAGVLAAVVGAIAGGADARLV